MKKHEFFTALADIIAKYGWVQGFHGNAKQGFCVLGAQDYVLGEGVSYLVWKETDTWLSDFLDWVGVGASDTIIAWNDAGGRTKEEVLINLRKYSEEVEHASTR